MSILRSVKSKGIELLLQLLAPDSVKPENIKVNLRQYEKGDSIIRKLKPGDMIFTQTPHSFYAFIRLVCGMTYDHVVVVLNDKEAIHISPPIISRISLRHVTLPIQNCQVVRPHLEPEELNKFLQLLSTFLGEKYSYESVMKSFTHFFGRQETQPFSLNLLKENKICSNIILYCLCCASEQFHKLLDENAMDMTYGRFGNMLPDSVKELVVMDPRSEIVYKEEKRYQALKIDIVKALKELWEVRKSKILFAKKCMELVLKMNNFTVVRVAQVMSIGSVGIYMFKKFGPIAATMAHNLIRKKETAKL